MHAADGQTRIAIIGDRVAGFAPQDAIGDAVAHAAASLGVAVPTIEWVPTDALLQHGPSALAGAAGVWCAPGGPYRSLDGALVGIRWARESSIPFIGTCAGFQHAVIEFARHVLGRAHAAHAEYDASAPADELFIDELLCSLVGQTMAVRIVDDDVQSMYGSAEATERYYCRFGLSPRWRGPLDSCGLRVAGVDAADGDVRIMRLTGHPFYVLTLFVPQTSSAPGAPHPLVTRFVTSALALSGEIGSGARTLA
jgi:CTP synthase (UTP-ammonia lyase)